MSVAFNPQVALSDPLNVRRLQRHLARAQERARSDVCSFFEYVLVEEHTRKRIKVLPHQRVALDFIMSHDRSVNMWPVGHSKTFTMAGLSLFLLGQNPTLRGAIISATQEQAEKPLKMVRQYIEEDTPEAARLRLVFPHLRPSTRKGDPWTQTAITIERPAGIRDASLRALGVDGALPGSRLNWIIIDDILSRDNTATPEQREKVFSWLGSTVFSRLDPRGSRVVVTNTPWHPDDVCHRLERKGWPTMRMSVDGNLLVTLPPIEEILGERLDDPWGEDGVSAIAPELRPANDQPPKKREDGAWIYDLRLSAHDPDPENKQTLWTEKFDRAWVDKMSRTYEGGAVEFNKLYRMVCRDDDSSMCKSEWIENCKKKARDRGIYGCTSRYSGPNQVFMGVDLAVSPGEEADDTAFFIFECLPDGHRVILDVEYGKFDGPTIVRKILEKNEKYSTQSYPLAIRVENNNAQDFIRQFALREDVSLILKPHTTGRNKVMPDTGVPSLFIEIENGAWLIPNDSHGQCSKQVQRLVDACLYYLPSKHTDDVLMAMWFAREQARSFGLLSGSQTSSVGNQSIAASIMMR